MSIRNGVTKFLALEAPILWSGLWYKLERRRRRRKF